MWKLERTLPNHPEDYILSIEGKHSIGLHKICIYFSIVRNGDLISKNGTIVGCICPKQMLIEEEYEGLKDKVFGKNIKWRDK